MVAGLCHFVVSSFRLVLWRSEKKLKNAMRKDELTKKRHAKKTTTKRRNNARRKDEITKSATREDEKQARKDEKTPFKIHIFRLFVILSFHLALFRLSVSLRGVFLSFVFSCGVN